MSRSAEVKQIAASLLVALLIAAAAIWAVTEHFGPTSVAKLEAQEDRLDARLDAREELRKDREDAREKREDSGSGNSG